MQVEKGLRARHELLLLASVPQSVRTPVSSDTWHFAALQAPLERAHTWCGVLEDMPTPRIKTLLGPLPALCPKPQPEVLVPREVTLSTAEPPTLARVLDGNDALLPAAKGWQQGVQSLIAGTLEILLAPPPGVHLPFR